MTKLGLDLGFSRVNISENETHFRDKVVLLKLFLRRSIKKKLRGKNNISFSFFSFALFWGQCPVVLRAYSWFLMGSQDSMVLSGIEPRLVMWMSSVLPSLVSGSCLLFIYWYIVYYFLFKENFNLDLCKDIYKTQTTMYYIFLLLFYFAHSVVPTQDLLWALHLWTLMALLWGPYGPSWGLNPY